MTTPFTPVPSVSGEKTMTVCWVGWVPFFYAVGVATGGIIGFGIGALIGFNS